MAADVTIRPMVAGDVDAADRVTRIAFGTFIGLAEPETMFGEMQHVRSRFAADPGRAWVATLDGEVVGSVLATRWGSYASFGPLTVTPSLWDQGIARRLLEPVVERFDAWGVRLGGLYTFAQSTKHVGLYQRFGFWPQYLTAIMSREVTVADARPGPTLYSALGTGERELALAGAAAVTDAIFEGLDVAPEIGAGDALALGDTIVVHDGSALCGFAVCHLGAGEAGAGNCFVKFAAVSPGRGAGERFEALLHAVEALASQRGLTHVVAGVNLARHDAYRRMLALGYRARMQGVIMQRPNDPGYCRPDVHVIDDLR